MLPYNTNVNLENPDKEFLKSQLDTCNGLIAQKDLELKKLKESNDMRAKRITNLETLVQEARQFITKQNTLFKANNIKILDELDEKPNNHQTTSCDNTIKIYGLETKTSIIENQLTLLASKVESLQLHVLTNQGSPSTSNIASNQHMNNHGSTNPVYICDICEEQFYSKDDLKKHAIQHVPIPNVSCKKCNFMTNSNKELKEQKQKEHKPIQLECDVCKYTTVHSNQLEKHKRTAHSNPVLSCDSCSYATTDHSDLLRHQQGMHGGTFPCDKCDVKCTSKKDFIKHAFYKHGLHHGARYFTSKTRNQEPVKKLYQKDGKPMEASSNSSSTTLDSESQDENKSSNEQQSEYFQCKQSCSAIQKFFSSNEALDLHNQYFHPQVGNKPSENEKQ